MQYRPAWWLPDPHTMTMWGKFFRKADLPDLQLTRLPTPDGDELALVSAGDHGPGPVMLLVHGLEGGVNSHYAGGILNLAVQSGWRARMLIFRTCDGRMNKARRTYHSGETTDLDLVVRHLVGEFPGQPVGMVGVSLGGNVLLKWLGEKGDTVPTEVVAAMAISTPFDLARSSRAIDRGFARLYQWNFLRTLKAKARLKLRQHRDVCSLESLDAARTMWEFDDAFTAPLHQFADAEDYYRRSSSVGFLAGIRRPTLLLSAHDDPFYPRGLLRDVEAACASNPLLQTEFHERGGHVGFVEGTPWKPEYYVESRIQAFLGRHLGDPGVLRTAG